MAPSDHQIPRVLYQTYAENDLPEPVVRNRDAILRDNPGWRYEFFDDAARRNFIARECGRAALLAYDSIRPCYGAARADLFRYLLIYRRGGLYLDLKSSVTRPLDEIAARAGSMLLTTWEAEDPRFPGWGDHKELRAAGIPEYQQWYVMAAPHHPCLAAVCRRVIRNLRWYVPEIHGVGRYGVLRTTGPIAFSLAVATVADPPAKPLAHEAVGLRYTVFETAEAHRTAFPNPHYASRTEPIAEVGPARRLIGRGFTFARSTVRAIRPSHPAGAPP